MFSKEGLNGFQGMRVILNSGRIAAIPFEIPSEIKADIQVVPLPVAAKSFDKLAWKFSAKGSFDMKSAYLLTINHMEDVFFSGSWIWKLQTLPKIQMFIWKCMHNSVGVKECLARRGISLDTACPVCLEQPESISHALHDCRLVKPVWKQLGSHHCNANFFSQDFKLWLISNASSKSSHTVKGVPWAAGGGGLIRDDQGNWIMGFSRKIGKANSFLAETWVLRDGLLLCIQLNLNDVVVELDAKALVDALRNPLYTNTIVSSLFDDCRSLAAQIPHLSIKHTYREANRCAD
nr:uncharacterized protein LOC112026163 [Quercus suber]